MTAGDLQGVDYVAIDSAGQRLLSYSYDPAQLRRISVPAKALQACSSMEITTDFRDACIYVLARPVIERIVLSSMRSIKVHSPPPHAVEDDMHGSFAVVVRLQTLVKSFDCRAGGAHRRHHRAAARGCTARRWTFCRASSTSSGSRLLLLQTHSPCRVHR